MKILISTSHLNRILSQIDFDNDSISHVTLNGDMLAISCQNKSVHERITVLEFSPYVRQDNRRWDCLKDFMSRVDEQPIILHITEQVLNVIFQY